MNKSVYVKNTRGKLKKLSKNLPIIFHVMKPLGATNNKEEGVPNSASCSLFENKNMFCTKFYKPISKVIKF